MVQSLVQVINLLCVRIIIVLYTIQILCLIGEDCYTYAVMGNKLPIEFVQNAGDDFFLNQRGAKVFYDESRQPLLPIAKGKNVQIWEKNLFLEKWSSRWRMGNIMQIFYK